MSREVQQMFSRIAGRYDLANDVLSMGIHRLWRKQAVKLSGVRAGARVLDLCTGTGDQSFILAKHVGSAGVVIGLDFVMPMLSIASHKQRTSADLLANGASISFVHGDAMRLPFDNSVFDVVTISFGIRNVGSAVGCLMEINRVLKPGGRLMVLEFGRPQVGSFNWIYSLYGKWLMPRLGGFVTKDRAAYEYLPKTAAVFPDGFDFLELMRLANFKCLQFRAFLTGVAFAYTGDRA